MLSARYLQPIIRPLVDKQLCHLASKIVIRDLATIATTSSAIGTASSQDRRQVNSAPSSSCSIPNITDEKTINICKYEDVHPRIDTMLGTRTHVELPQYLKQHYWWAYINPTMISLLDRKWLVDVVLWGNFNKLRDAAVNELLNICQHEGTYNHDASSCCEEMIKGKTLQISCVYADLTETIVKKLAPDATLDVIDVVPAQLRNLQQKLQRNIAVSNHENLRRVKLSCCDASNLQTEFPSNNTFDNVLIFFLLHETPANVREHVLAEACRVLKHDGKIVVIDYHKPTTALWYYIMQFMYIVYEPFAIDLWKHSLSHWLPLKNEENMMCRKDLYFGGLYQKVVMKSG